MSNFHFLLVTIIFLYFQTHAFGRITYALDGDYIAMGFFTVSPTDGQVRTLSTLQRDSRTQYQVSHDT